MKVKLFFALVGALLIAFALLFGATSVEAAPLAEPSGPGIYNADPATNFVDVLGAVKASAAIGTGVVLLIQLGKSIGVFKNGTAKKWRIAILLIIAVLLYFGPAIGVPFDLADVDDMFESLIELGPYLSFIFIWFADYVSDKFYLGFVRGQPVVGKSYTLASKAAKAKKKKKLNPPKK